MKNKLVNKKRKFETDDEKQERLSQEKIEERDKKLITILDATPKNSTNPTV